MRLLTILLLLLSSTAFGKPHLLLHFDVNKTLITHDSTRKEGLEELLAQTKFDEAKKHMIRKKNAAWPVCRAFFSLIDYLEEHGYTYTLFLRSFGADLERTRLTINSVVGTPLFTQRAHFSKGKFNGTLTDPREIFQLFETSPHLVIQEDYHWWHGHGEKPRYGKPLYVDAASESTQFFFDDKADRIVAVIDVETGKKMRTLPSNTRVIKVDIYEAILNDNYFIDQIFSSSFE